MSYTKKQVIASNRDVLVEMVFDLQEKLKKKNQELYQTRVKLRLTKSKLQKMKGAVQFQRKRILELYQG